MMMSLAFYSGALMAVLNELAQKIVVLNEVTGIE